MHWSTVQAQHNHGVWPLLQNGPADFRQHWFQIVSRHPSLSFGHPSNWFCESSQHLSFFLRRALVLCQDKLRHVWLQLRHIDDTPQHCRHSTLVLDWNTGIEWTIPFIVCLDDISFSSLHLFVNWCLIDVYNDHFFALQWVCPQPLAPVQEGRNLESPSPILHHFCDPICVSKSGPKKVTSLSNLIFGVTVCVVTFGFRNGDHFWFKTWLCNPMPSGPAPPPS